MNKNEKNQQRILQKQMAEKLLETSEDKINRNIKDSVFCDLFGRPEYLYQLYQVLHPEDTETQSDDLTIVTLSRIIVHEMYNDLGFLAGNRLIVLVEDQSTWSVNIVVRFLMYIGETYRRYIEKNDLDLYTSKKLELPKPELYMVYTGNRKTRPETISLKRDIFGVDDGGDCCVEVEAKVIYGTGENDNTPGDILNQFIIFSKVFDEQRKLYPDDIRKAVQETIRICREMDVLNDYLAEEEAATVMYAFADQEREFSRALRKEALAGEARGEARGEINMLLKLVKKGRLTIEEAAEESNMTPDAFKQKYLM